jgi:hypothetical protein
MGVNTASFREAFDGYVDNLQAVFGEEAAKSYRAMREGETQVMMARNVDYPTAREQAQDFLSFRIAGDA